MEESYNELVSLVESMKDDAQKFFGKQQKAAGKRLRKNSMDIKKLCHKFRQELTEEINSI